MQKGMLKFGLSSVQNGQKTSVVNAKPQLTVCSTEGKFAITAPVSKALDVRAGEYIMFFHNFDKVREAIANNNPDVLAYAQERELDVNEPSDVEILVKELGNWFIAKGEKEYDQTGKEQLVAMRFTKADKLKFIEENAEKLVEENREKLLEMLGADDATFEELKSVITVDMIESPTMPKYRGSRTANVSGSVITGVPLSFTDTSTWNSFKSDLEDKTSANRVYDVDIEHPADFEEYFNGYENITVKVYALTFVSDEKPFVRSSK